MQFQVIKQFSVFGRRCSNTPPYPRLSVKPARAGTERIVCGYSTPFFYSRRMATMTISAGMCHCFIVATLARISIIPSTYVCQRGWRPHLSCSSVVLSGSEYEELAAFKAPCRPRSCSSSTMTCNKYRSECTWSKPKACHQLQPTIDSVQVHILSSSNRETFLSRQHPYESAVRC